MEGPHPVSPTRGLIVEGALFPERMRIETVEQNGAGWTLGLVGLSSEVFRRVPLSIDEFARLAIVASNRTYDGDAKLFRLGLQAYGLGIAWEFDPWFALSISRVDPLPHQLEAVYEHLLKLARVRFLLADDAGAGKTVHERLFAVALTEQETRLVEPSLLNDFQPAPLPVALPGVASVPEAKAFLHAKTLGSWLETVRGDRGAEIARIRDHVELCLKELIQRADDAIGRASEEVEHKVPGAEGKLALADVEQERQIACRDRRSAELEREAALSLQAVERIASTLILPHPERNAPELQHLRQNRETETAAMRLVMNYECKTGRTPSDVSAR